tara:strand:+ start:6461 stop:6673 length:213 start_codon:yes stop_codon:yes gene_type:complete
MQKKYKIKDLSIVRHKEEDKERITGTLTLLKKWSKNNIEWCIVTTTDGYEYKIKSDNLDVIKKEKKEKKK